MVARARQTAANFVNNILNFIRNLPGMVWSFLLTTLSRVTSFGSTALSRARTAGRNIYNGIRNAITVVPGMVYNELLGIIGKITSIGGAAYNAAHRLGEQVYNGLKSALGIGSPGYMFYMVEGELGRITDLMAQTQSDFNDMAQGLGSSMTTGFNNGTPNLVNTLNTNSQVDVNLKVDLLNVPAGNSDVAIADMVSRAVTDRAVLDRISRGLYSGVARTRRSQGV